ncbi:hypothetical protein ScPMuIL_011504 [Solemya velum]
MSTGNKTTNMAAFKARLKEFEELLNTEVIDLKKLRKLCFNGCPESGYSVRAVCWKLLLEYLPVEKSEWKNHLTKQRSLYKQFVDELIVKPGANAPEGNNTDVTMADHPLNPSPNSEWAAYFRDNEMLLQIDKDCRRLCPDLFFFQRATDYPCTEIVTADFRVETLRKRVEQTVLQSATVSSNRLGITGMVTRPRKSSHEYAVLPDGQEAHWEVLERILFLFSKLNPGLGYVQGMNEIVGPIYYTFATDPNEDCREHAEEDAFFCFTGLMSEIKDNFMKSLDDSHLYGIGNMMTQLTKMVESKDPALGHRMEEVDLKPQYYAFRWLTLLMSQEFPLPDVLRIWDSLFSDENRFSFLIHIACAMLILIRKELFESDFPCCMKLVQNYPYMTVDIQTVLKKAVEIMR